MDAGGERVTRAQFEMDLAAKRTDRVFTADIQPYSPAATSGTPPNGSTEYSASSSLCSQENLGKEPERVGEVLALAEAGQAVRRAR